MMHHMALMLISYNGYCGYHCRLACWHENIAIYIYIYIKYLLLQVFGFKPKYWTK